MKRVLEMLKDRGILRKYHFPFFKLFDYIPYVWESGHKIRYTLNINTGVELYAEVVDWIEAGYIEGVILPPAEIK